MQEGSGLYDGPRSHRMANGKACHPESPGFRRGLLVGSPGPEGRVEHQRADARPANRGTTPRVRGHHPPRLPPGASCGITRPGGPGRAPAGGCPPSEPRHDAAGSRSPSSPASAGGFLWDHQARRAGSLTVQEAPGGNPGTPGVKTTPPSMQEGSTATAPTRSSSVTRHPRHVPARCLTQRGLGLTWAGGGRCSCSRCGCCGAISWR
jgi:hypothetical protein